MEAKIVNESDDPKTAHFLMDCAECVFFDGDCEFGRRQKYSEMGIVDGTKIKTFCPYGRDKLWKEKYGHDLNKVRRDNRVKYDLIVRVDDSIDIGRLDSFISLPNPPRKIVLSYTSRDTKDLLERTCNTNLQLLKIYNPERRLDLEYNAVKLEDKFNANVDASYFQIVNLANFDHTLIEKFDRLINEEMARTICVPGHIYLKLLCQAMIADEMEICDENIINKAKEDGCEFMVRKVEDL